MYSILFKAVSETLLELSSDKKYLGAEIGFMAILHTWGQNFIDKLYKKEWIGVYVNLKVHHLFFNEYMPRCKQKHRGFKFFCKWVFLLIPLKRIFPSKVNEDSIPFQPQERDKMILFKCKKCESNMII